MNLLRDQKSIAAGIYFFAMMATATGTGGTHVVPEKGYTGSNIRVIGVEETRTAQSHQLEAAKHSFGITVTALCKVFGVSRQTYYNWLKGEAPSPENMSLLAKLSEAGRLLHGLTGPKSLLLSQPIKNGQTFWQLLQAGNDPVDLAEVIRARALRREGERDAVRSALQRKRAKNTINTSSDDVMG